MPALTLQLINFLTYVLLAVDCGPLNETANGAVNTSSGTTFMMTATYTCITGYNIVGSESRTCGTSGTSGVWSREAPVCNCKKFTHIPNLHVLWLSVCPFQWFLWVVDRVLLPTTLPYHWRPLDPLSSPVILSYPPAVGNKTAMAALLLEDGQDQMVSAFLIQTPTDSTCHEVWAPLVWTMLKAPVK